MAAPRVDLGMFLVRDTQTGASIQDIHYPLKTFHLAFAGTSARKDIDGQVSAILLISTQDCFFSFGDASVTASAASDDSHYLPAKVPLKFQMREHRSIAAIQASAAGTLHVMVLG